MSDRPIQVGDLVVVIYWPICDCGIGAIHTVEKIGSLVGLSDGCALCGRAGIKDIVDASEVTILTGFGSGKRGCVGIRWLKRIPPLEEIQQQRLREEEPA